GLYNPFAEYRKRVEDFANEYEISRENVLIILLSLNPQKSTEGLHGFTPVTYDEFFSVLLRNIGQKTLDADHRCWIYLRDFITTIQNLRSEICMKKELLEFFKKHEQIALEFNRRLKDLADYLRSRTEKMADGV